MRKYLSSLKHRSDSHKKHFALAVSSGVTLSIFSLWALANFGAGGPLAGEAQPAAVARANEVSPLDSLKKGMSEGFQGISDTLQSIKEGVSDSIDFEADYTEMKTNVLNIYGPVRNQ